MRLMRISVTSRQPCALPGGSGGATAASICNARLTDLAKDKLIAPVPTGPGRDGLSNEMR